MSRISRIPVPMPFGGVSQLSPSEDQPQQITGRAMNVRPVDPMTLRARISQREGSRLWSVSRVTDVSGGATNDWAGFVQAVGEVAIDQPAVDYAAIGNPDWVLDTGQSDDVEWSLKVTRQDGAANAVAFNPLTRNGWAGSEGNVVRRFNVNRGSIQVYWVEGFMSSSEEIQAIAMDESDAAYIGSAVPGQLSNVGRLTKLSIALGGLAIAQDWQIDLGGDVQDVKLDGDGRCYCAVNKPNRTADVVVVSGIDTANPFIAQRFPVPYPASQIELADGGEFFVASLENANRYPGGFTPGADPCRRNVSGIAPDASGFVMSGHSLWGWWKADDIDQGAFTLVSRWDDASGNNRHFYATGDQGTRRPAYVVNGVCRNPSLRFEGSEALRTASGDDSATSAGAWPTEPDTGFILSMAVRVSDLSRMRYLMGVGGNSSMRFAVNGRGIPSSGVSFDTEVEAPGFVTMLHRHAGEERSLEDIRDQAKIGTHSADGLCILTFIMGDTIGDASVPLGTGSMARLNGRTVKVGNIRTAADRTLGEASGDEARFYLGMANRIFADATNTQALGFVGDIAEIVCVSLPASASQANRMDQAEIIEGYLAHKFALHTLLQDTGYDPDGSFSGGSVQSVAQTLGSEGNHPFNDAPPSGGSMGSVGSTPLQYDVLMSPYGILCKLDANGNVVWAETGSGVGAAVRRDPLRTGRVFSWGPERSVGDLSGGPSGGFKQEHTVLRSIIDEGGSFIASGGSAWGISGGALGLSVAPTNQYLTRMDVDRFGRLYVPMEANQASNASLARVAGSTGAVAWTEPVRGNANNTNNLFGRQIVIDQEVFGFAGQSIEDPRWGFIVGDSREEASSQYHNFFRLDFVSTTQSERSPRARHVITCAGGDVRRARGPAHWTEISGGSVAQTITGGEDALNAAAKNVWMSTLFGKVYMTDGLAYKVYDPVSETVADWEATAGELPTKAKLLETWRGRVLLARTEGEPSNIYMSAIGDAQDWDYYPAVPLSISAVNLLTAPAAGKIPDVVNAMIPYSDDLLIVGCDSSIYRVTGDLLGGGRVETITSEHGMAFGRPWCIDSAGVVYYMGSDGSFYRYVPAPGALPQRISMPIDGLAQAVDLARFTCRMAWDQRLNGIRIRYTLMGDAVETADTTPPRVDIAAPVDDGATASYTVGTAPAGFDLVATSEDVVDGDLTSAIHWQISGGSTLGSGGSIGSFLTADWGEGDYKVVAFADDAAGNRGKSYINISITEPAASGGSSGPTGPGIPIPSPTERDRVVFEAAEEIYPFSLDWPETGQDGAYGGAVGGWFFHIPTGGWWVDVNDDRALDAQAMVTLDGDDPKDRVIVEGGIDGHVRYVDYESKADEKSQTAGVAEQKAITSSVYIGPLTPRSGANNVRVSNARVTLSAGSDAAVAAGHVSQQADAVRPTADVEATLRWSKDLLGGDSDVIRQRARGRAVWISLTNGNVAETFSIESIDVDIFEASRGRTSYDS